MASSATTQSFLSSLSASKYESLLRRPNYWTSNPAHLLTTCDVTDVALGTGASIYSSLLPTLESTESELILVTCFWARSASLDTLCAALRSLSAKALSRRSKIRVRICVSSVSLWQKLLHTQRLEGYVYPRSAWEAKLGLPPPDQLRGLDLQVKSVFVKPFSVMHPKFIVVDRRRVLLPSCNVSWEDWFEGCVGLSGDVVGRFVEFWEDFWRGDATTEALEGARELRDVVNDSPPMLGNLKGQVGDDNGPAGPCKGLEESPGPFVYRCRSTESTDYSVERPGERLSGTGLLSLVNIRTHGTPCVFLPSPHSINPRFRLPWQEAAPPPSTPLNVFLLAALRTAKRNIYIQTPNLTAPPVLSAVLQTLKRGIDVHIVTSEKLMILEQLVTAGTTTSRCVRKLIKRYAHAKSLSRSIDYADATTEEGRAYAIGHLRIEYYRPAAAEVARARIEPVQSHLKLTLVDDELVVLGSGNLDRASWYTSQELGVAVLSPGLAVELRRTLDDGVLKARKKLVFDGL